MNKRTLLQKVKWVRSTLRLEHLTPTILIPQDASQISNCSSRGRQSVETQNLQGLLYGGRAVIE